MARGDSLARHRAALAEAERRLTCGFCGRVHEGSITLTLRTDVAVRVSGNHKTQAGDVRMRHIRAGRLTICPACWGPDRIKDLQYPTVEALREAQDRVKAALRDDR